MKNSDDEVVGRIRGGDRQAWGEAYRRYAGAVRAAAARVLGSQQPGGFTPDDVVSEVFMKMMGRDLSSGIQTVESLGAYLIRSGRNRALDEVTSKKATEEVTDDPAASAPPVLGEDPEELAVNSVLVARVFGHLPSLTENERYVFVQRVMRERDRDEIAQELGVKPQRVSQLVEAATAKLRRAIGDVEGRPPSRSAADEPSAPKRRQK